jgi:DNA-binding CsgD family transcriptional regulator
MKLNLAHGYEFADELGKNSFRFWRGKTKVINRPQLCVLAPDSFYAEQLAKSGFPSFQAKVFQSVDDVESCGQSLTPSICLLFGSQLSPLSLAEAILYMRTKFRAAKILQVDGLSSPAVHQVWPVPSVRDLAGKPVSFVDIKSLDIALLTVSDGWDALVRVSESLTDSQIGVLAALAAGQSNREIAQSRGTTTRAVESLVNRTFVKVGLGEKASARTRSQKAQDFLASLGTTSRVSSFSR